jgi:hypothetical protein
MSKRSDTVATEVRSVASIQSKTSICDLPSELVEQVISYLGPPELHATHQIRECFFRVYSTRKALKYATSDTIGFHSDQQFPVLLQTLFEGSQPMHQKRYHMSQNFHNWHVPNETVKTLEIVGRPRQSVLTSTGDIVFTEDVPGCKWEKLHSRNYPLGSLKTIRVLRPHEDPDSEIPKTEWELLTEDIEALNFALRLGRSLTACCTDKHLTVRPGGWSGKIQRKVAVEIPSCGVEAQLDDYTGAMFADEFDEAQAHAEFRYKQEHGMALPSAQTSDQQETAIATTPALTSGTNGQSSRQWPVIYWSQNSEHVVRCDIKVDVWQKAFNESHCQRDATEFWEAAYKVLTSLASSTMQFGSETRTVRVNLLGADAHKVHALTSMREREFYSGESLESDALNPHNLFFFEGGENEF